MWSKRFGNASNQYAFSGAADALENVIVTGSFSGTVDFGGGALTSAGGDDIFIAKLTPVGTHVWSMPFGDASAQSADFVAVDAASNIIITGSFSGAVDFGGGELASAGDYDIFISAFNQNGTHIWSKAFGDEYRDRSCGAAVDAWENIIVTGSFGGAIDFGGGELANVGLSDIFLARFDRDGVHLWSKAYGDSYEDSGNATEVDASGNVFVTGAFDGTVNFGGGGLTSAGGSDIFLTKFGLR